MSWPAKRTVPVSGLRKPDISANSVVLPAPLGPISALRLPSATDRLTPCTAFRPPKEREMPFSTSSGSATGTSLRGRPELPHREPQAGDAARQEDHDQHQHRAVDHHVDARQLAEQ